ncbi:MAG: helix-turn-helix transcriptional regulator [Ammonifex sp.]|nr:MAG: helix-turn-helix transcriptional regulator [Ammonifex sp.]
MSLFSKDLGPPDYGAYLCSPAELKASYDRCRALQVPVELERPQKILPKSTLSSRRRENSLLLTYAEEVITPHHYSGPQDSHIYILCNPELVALKIFAAPEILVAAEEVGVRPGTVFTEESCGTNALALAREHNRLVAIRGEQHYCKLFKDWWCVASPVKDPEGRIIGYLDISLHAEKELGLTIALLKILLTSIERECLLSHSQQTNTDVTSPLHTLLRKSEQKLTRRQKEVLQLKLSGLKNDEIAAKLSLSIFTVETHCRNIYSKLGVGNFQEFLRKFQY